MSKTSTDGRTDYARVSDKQSIDPRISDVPSVVATIMPEPEVFAKPIAPKLPSEAIYERETNTETQTKWPEYSVYVKCEGCKQKGNSKIVRALSRCGIVTGLILCVTIIAPIIIVTTDYFYISKHYCEHCNHYFGSSEK